MEARYDFKRSILNNIYEAPSVTISGVITKFDMSSKREWNRILTPLVTSYHHETSVVMQN